MHAGGVLIRQLGSFKIGDDFLAVVQVKEIARHDEPHYGERLPAVFDCVRTSEIEHWLRNRHTNWPGRTIVETARDPAPSVSASSIDSIRRVDPSYDRIVARLQKRNRPRGLLYRLLVDLIHAVAMRPLD